MILNPGTFFVSVICIVSYLGFPSPYTPHSDNGSISHELAMALLLSFLTYLLLELDECSSSPCENNGTCFSELDNYRCQCPERFTGQNCEGLSFAGYIRMYDLLIITGR